MSKNINVPQLRFREFSGEWEEKKLGDIATKIGSGNTPLGGEKVYTEEGVLFIRSQNVNNDKLELSDKTFIPIEIHNKMKSSKVSSSDVLLNITGASIGRSCVVPDNIVEANVNQHVCIVRGDKTLNSNFLQTFISSFKGQKLISQGQTGSGREGLNFQSIASFKLNLPDIKEQEKIASFLTSVDTKIEQLTKKETLLQEYKKGVMAQIFSRKIRFKDDNGSEFSEWEEKKLGEFGTTFNGLTGKTSENFGSGKPYIQYKQIFDNSKINIDNFGYVDIKPNEKQNKVCFGDMFFTTSSETPNEVGFSSVLLENIDDLYLNSFCFGYRVKSLSILSPYFSRYLFRSANFRKEAIKLAQGSTRYNISKIELMKVSIKLPCLEEQTKIANFLSSIDKKIELVQRELEKIKEFKKALLQQMFV